MDSNESIATLAVLANANEFVNAIAQGVIGNEVADTINGSPLTRDAIFNLTQTKMQTTVAPYLGVR